MPGRLFPPDRPRSDHLPERLVWEALREGLPEGWRAFHSLKLKTVQRRFGEGDFIVAIPDRGVLIVEVKGGKIDHVGGHWLQNDRPMRQGPLEQAHGFRKKLRDALTRECGERVPIGVACCFPQTASSERPTNSDLRDVVIFEQELADIGRALERAVDATITPGNAPRSTAWMDALHTLWGADWSPRVGLLDRARAARRKIEKLNAQQESLLDQVDENPRLTVRGGAGTGKSTVAVELAERRAWTHQKVRYLCFTEALAKWVDAHFHDEREAGNDIRAVPVRARALELAREWQLPIELDPRTAEEWDHLLDAVTAAMRERDHDRPDFVVVDEGQSFAPRDWAIVNAAIGERTGLWVFHDPFQAFWTDHTLPEDFQRGHAFQFVLPRQERTPRSIHALAQAYVGEADEARVRERFEPDEILLVEAGGDVAQAVAGQLDRLFEHGIEPDDVAVLTLVGKTASALWGAESIGKHLFVHGDHPEADRNLIVETFMRFQGLDRPILVICEGDHDSARWHYEARMHMALTRASCGVVLVCGDTARERDPWLQVLQSLQDEDVEPS